MTARKKKTTARKRPATRRKPTRRKKKPSRGPLAALARAPLPRSLAQVRRRIAANLNGLERELLRARSRTRRRSARLLREASRQLGRLEALGERGWRDLSTRPRRELALMLRRLERAVAPPAPRGRRKKKA